MRLSRRVEPEIARPPAGSRSARDPRRGQDLRRINRVMAAQSILCRGIDAATRGGPPRAASSRSVRGDGTLLLRVARQRAANWPGVDATLVDRQNLVSARTAGELRGARVELRVVTRDVFDWLDETPPVPHDLLFANLFLHHFAADALPRLLAGIADRSTAFVACEPRRAAVALVGSRLVGLLGCNEVTRHDAVVSVRAGFRDAELTAAWPETGGWRIDEYPAGLFTHCFWRQRGDAMTATVTMQIGSAGYDALVVGGGPAGATAAILLAQAGWRVAVVEKKPFPRRKVCGEFISAHQLAAVARPRRGRESLLGAGRSGGPARRPLRRRRPLSTAADAARRAMQSGMGARHRTRAPRFGAARTRPGGRRRRAAAVDGLARRRGRRRLVCTIVANGERRMRRTARPPSCARAS